MTRSMFDPTGGDMERGGWRFTPPDAERISQMPPEVVDGKVEPDEGGPSLPPGRDDDAVDPNAVEAAGEARAEEDDGKLNPDSVTDVARNPGQELPDDITGIEDI